MNEWYFVEMPDNDGNDILIVKGDPINGEVIVGAPYNAEVAALFLTIVLEHNLEKGYDND